MTMDQFREGLLFLIALILSISVHEFGHALVATKLGDPLPKAQGRLTLSPISHADPIGTLLLPAIMLFAGGGGMGLFGWGRPVQTNPSSYTRRFSQATGHLMVSLAGPMMNLLMALVVSAGLLIGIRLGMVSGSGFLSVFRHLIALNLLLMCFNLLPIPPLDGGAVLSLLLPRSQQYIIDFLSRWGFLILLGLVLIPQTSALLFGPIRWLQGQWGDALLRLAGS